MLSTMAADPVTADTAAELLNYDILSDDDLFTDKTLSNSRDDKPILSPRGTKRKSIGDDKGDVLGLDEEVKIAKKRKPAVKLDEQRWETSALDATDRVLTSVQTSVSTRNTQATLDRTFFVSNAEAANEGQRP